ncbi:hypothetical protein PMAYCL1PPCAC_30783, partial [Pristionchus mayeri]
GLGLASPLVVHLLSDKGEVDGLSIGSSLEDVVAADGHRHCYGGEAGSQVGHLNILRDGLVGLHVEALDAVGTINLRTRSMLSVRVRLGGGREAIAHLGHELGMEGDDDGGGDEDTTRVERTSALHVANVEGKGDRGDLRACGVVAASRVIVQPLKLDVSGELVADVGVDGDGGGAALDLRLSDNFVVDGNGANERKKSKEDEDESSHRRRRRKRRWDGDWGTERDLYMALGYRREE